MFCELECHGLLQLLTINKCYRNVVGTNVTWKVTLFFFCLMIPAFQNKMSIRVNDLHITNKTERLRKKFIDDGKNGTGVMDAIKTAGI